MYSDKILTFADAGAIPTNRAPRGKRDAVLTPTASDDQPMDLATWQSWGFAKRHDLLTEVDHTEKSDAALDAENSTLEIRVVRRNQRRLVNFPHEFL